MIIDIQKIWHNLTVPDTLNSLQTSINGLTSEEAQKRLVQFGSNELVGKESVTSLVSPSLPLASEPDDNYQRQTVQLEPGDHVVLFKPTVILPGAEDTKIMDAPMLAAALQAARTPQGNLLDTVCAVIDDLAPAADHAILIVHRLSAEEEGRQTG